MGQEAGKPAWPKPAGGYQTITGRRYGRRHAYVSFRPNSAKHRSGVGVEWTDTELNTVHREPSLAPKGNISSMLQAILPMSSNVVHPELKPKSGNEASGKKQLSRRPAEAPSVLYKKLRSEQTGAGVGDHEHNTEKSSEASAWPVPEEEDANVANASVANASVANASVANASVANASALSFVNIDSYEPDSSGGEEESPGSDPSLGLQRRLDDMIFELGKEFDYLSGLHSYLYTKSCEGTDCLVKDPAVKDLSNSSDPEDTVPQRSSPEQTGHTESDQTLTSPGSPGECAAGLPPVCLIGSGNDTEQTGPSQTEMVVRPKIRKQTSETHLEKRKSSYGEEEKSHNSGSSGRTAAGGKTKCVSAPPFFLTQTERPNHDLLFSFPLADCAGVIPIERRGGGRREAEEGYKVSSDEEEEEEEELEDIWEDLDFNDKCAPFMKAEESSECSEGEWSASWTSDSGLEKGRGSSEESWETLPGLEELQAPSSGLDPSTQPSGEQAPLEEGEVPWLMYNEETCSSSDEEDPEGMSHFVHPGLFILDGNNNLEDDSSVSEDLDAEWRLLDDFGEGFGMAQAISYVDPHLLTYMALEERLAQAMEAALAHLESLAIDVEQAHPPATEQMIECLPQIPMQDDLSGQEQSCAICCCEYVKDEIATQLPCHHMFHKICVTLWLQKSGTCPVCRHVLTPALPEALAPTSFVSDQDIPPSNHSAAGTR
ncbi:E3 ubiquitin-protein ligase Praja-2 [Osmerus mordax]|uniref:E3 ubiquitin-protein ligase Praja-2 n=1 Tax=Osmerus mordax TaxID=8014 RepID=UPI00350E8F7E